MTRRPRREGNFILFPNQRMRGRLAQLLLAIVLLWLMAEAAGNAVANLTERGIATGFGFLNSTAGFSIVQTLIPYDEGASYGRAFLVGLANTLLVSALGISVATAIGFLIGIARLSPNWLMARLATAYIEIVRNIPLLLQILFWYTAVLASLPGPRASVIIAGSVFLNNRGLYLPAPESQPGAGLVLAGLALGLGGAFLVWRHRAGRPWAAVAALTLALGLPALAVLHAGPPIAFQAPALQGFNLRGGMRLIPELVALLIALSTYTAAFVAETVRSGIQSVDRGQIEAARAIGLRPGLTLRLIVIPQAMRVIVPPLTSHYLSLTKNSSLAVAIGYPDLVSVFAGTTLNQTGQAVEVLFLTMAVYLTLSLATAWFMNWYNARVAVVGG